MAVLKTTEHNGVNYRRNNGKVRYIAQSYKFSDHCDLWRVLRISPGPKGEERVLANEIASRDKACIVAFYACLWGV